MCFDGQWQLRVARPVPDAASLNLVCSAMLAVCSTGLLTGVECLSDEWLAGVVIYTPHIAGFVNGSHASAGGQAGANCASAYRHPGPVWQVRQGRASSDLPLSCQKGSDAVLSM